MPFSVSGVCLRRSAAGRRHAKAYGEAKATYRVLSAYFGCSLNIGYSFFFVHREFIVDVAALSA